MDSWFNLTGANPLSRILGFTILASFFNPTSPDTTSSYITSGAGLVILGTLLEVGRRFCQWLYERFNIFRETSLPLHLFSPNIDNLNFLQNTP
jgi:chaperone BCS1